MATRCVMHFALLVTTIGTKEEAATCAWGPGRSGQEVLDANSFLQLVTDSSDALNASGAEEAAPGEEIAKAEIDLLKEREEHETEIFKQGIDLLKEHGEQEMEILKNIVNGHAAGEDGAGNGSAIEMEGMNVGEEEKEEKEARGAAERSTRAVAHVANGRVLGGINRSDLGAAADYYVMLNPGEACDSEHLITSKEECFGAAWPTFQGRPHPCEAMPAWTRDTGNYDDCVNGWVNGWSNPPRERTRSDALGGCLYGEDWGWSAIFNTRSSPTNAYYFTFAICKAPAPPADPGPDQSSVVGDPHVVSVTKERFDIRAEGAHKLVQIPQFIRANGKPDLRVDAKIEHLVGNDCSKSFMTSLSIFGRWTEEAAFGLMHITQGSDMPNTTLLVNKEDPEAFFKEFPLAAVQAGRTSLAFKVKGVGFHVGKHFEGRHGKQRAYLNVRITGLKQYKDLGGLLGYDGHADAEKPDANCTVARPAVADQSSFIGTQRSAPSTDGGSRIEAE